MKSKNLFIISLFIIYCSVFIVFVVQAGYEIEVVLPGMPAGQTEFTLSEYINYIYLFGLGLIAVVALGTLVYGGLTYMLSDTITSKDDAKKYIWGAISGLVLGLSAYLILKTINPDLVTLTGPTLPPIEMPELPPGVIPTPCEDDNQCDTANCEFCLNNLCKSACHSECETCEAGTCEPKETGTSCRQGTRVCENGQCLTCETEGGWCTFDACCSGLICDVTFTPDKCTLPLPATPPPLCIEGDCVAECQGNCDDALWLDVQCICLEF